MKQRRRKENHFCHRSYGKYKKARPLSSSVHLSSKINKIKQQKSIHRIKRRREEWLEENVLGRPKQIYFGLKPQ
jgi:hypothetical protein